MIKAEIWGAGRAGQKEKMKAVQSSTLAAHQQWCRTWVTAEQKNLHVTSFRPLYSTGASQVEWCRFSAFSTAEQLHQRERALLHLCAALEMLQHTPGAFISLNTEHMKVRSLFTVHCAVKSAAGDKSSQLMRMQNPLSTPEIRSVQCSSPFSSCSQLCPPLQLIKMTTDRQIHHKQTKV